MLDYIINQLKQPSTWLGLISVVGGAFGWTVSADLTQSIVALGVALAGLIGVIYREQR